MDRSKENPMWGSSGQMVDDENTLHNMLLPTASWSSPSPMPVENLSNDIPPSPFSEFFLPRNFGPSHEIPIFDSQSTNDIAEICGPQKSGGADRLNFNSTVPTSKDASGAFFSPQTTNELCQSSKKLLISSATQNKSSKSLQKNSSTGFFSCDICSFIAVDRHTFMVHKRSKHYGEKSFSCNDCSAKFTRSYSLKKHVLQKHQGFTPSPQLPKYCPFPGCSYVTRSANTMQIHKRSHQNASMYYCKQCNIRYARRQSLLHHLTQKHSSNAGLIGIIRSNNTPDVNNLKLNSQSSATVVVETAAKEHEEKLYNCDKCTFTSKNFLDVYRHKQSAQHVVDDEKSYMNKNICLYCHKKFASSNNLLTHIKKEHLETRKKLINETKKMFFCSKCSFSTTRKKVLKAHEDNSHIVMMQQQAVCYNVGTTPMIGRSPPKSDRNSVHSDCTYVNYATNTITTTTNQQSINNLPADLSSTMEACSSSYRSFSASSSSILHDNSTTNNNNNGCCGGGATINGNNVNNNCNGGSATRNLSSAAVTNNSTCSLPSSSSSSFDELASCVHHIQSANNHLLQLCRRRENELKNLRANVIELLKQIYPNSFNFFGQNISLSLESVDQLVVNAINGNFS